MTYDILVVVGGFWGCTAARALAEQNLRGLLCEAKDYIGGTAKSFIKEGIEIHCFGSHIFHTNSMDVWRFANRFTEFNNYQHKVISYHKGQFYFMPISLPLVNKFFNVELKPGKITTFLNSKNRLLKIHEAFFMAILKNNGVSD